MKKYFFLFFAFFLSGMLFFSQHVVAQTAGVPSGSGVQPVVVSAPASCVDIGLGYGIRVEGNNGRFAFNGSDGILTGGAPINLDDTLTISNSDGVYFNWSANLGIDAVIVKGGPNANVYSYNPEATGDTHLHPPINPNTNMPYVISNIEVCYDYEVDIQKTAVTTFTRTYGWTIDKSVSPSSWGLFTGDSGTSEFTVTVDKDNGTDSDWAVSGTITVHNNTNFNAVITGISDLISGGINASVVCEQPLPFTIPPRGGSLNCSYTAPLPDGSDRLNTATVSTSGIVSGGEATADVIFGDPTTVVNNEINVTDTNGESWGPVSDDASWKYERTYSCDADAGENNNVASIVETGQSDDATVTVNCYGISVSTTVNPSLARNWDWTIDKTADQTALTLSTGQQFQVNYSVGVSAISVDSDWAVEGDIMISNPHPSRAAVLTGVADVISPAIAASVSCPTLTVPAGGSLNCTYGASLPDAATRTNTATATLKNFSYASNGTASDGGTTSISGIAVPVDFSNATIGETDECIDVYDTHPSPDLPGEACASTSPASFDYPITVGPYDVCGEYTVENTASFVTRDEGRTGEDSWTVIVNVPCAGCSLTPGYWKTHSSYGPAPMDDSGAWEAVGGPDAPFFLSGQTYYEVLWTSPRGNAYYILVRAYIAAKLNFLSGADPSAAQAAFDAATLLFQTYTPDQIAALKGKNGKELRAQFISLATTLDHYNNGLIGPGHCDEDDSSNGLTSNAITTPGAPLQAEVMKKEGLWMEQNRPNPFRETTLFTFGLPEAAKVQLKAYNLNGQLVSTVTDRYLEAGQYKLEWNVPAELPSGVYLYRLQVGDDVLTKRMNIVK